MRYLIYILLLLILFSCEKEKTENNIVNPNTIQQEISMVDISDCKNNFDKSNSKIDSIWWQYVGNELQIFHYNAAFNCCPEGFSFRMEMISDTIIVKESDSIPLCHCCCLYDVQYNINNILDIWTIYLML